jgi:hypothetical protein
MTGVFHTAMLSRRRQVLVGMPINPLVMMFPLFYVTSQRIESSALVSLDDAFNPD